jgi:hypothetical protein
MKTEENDDIRPEYDFTNALRGKHYERYRQAVEDLRREVQKGLDQLDRGESVLLDPGRIKAEGRRRLAV